jgi:hypothetical protein
VVVPGLEAGGVGRDLLRGKGGGVDRGVGDNSLHRAPADEAVADAQVLMMCTRRLPSGSQSVAVTTASIVQRVSVQLRTPIEGRQATISRVRLVGLYLPPEADLHESVHDGVLDVDTTAFVEFLSLSVSPREEGDYLVLAAGAITEGDGGETVLARVVDHEGSPWPEPGPDQEPFRMHREGEVSLLWARIVRLGPGEHAFRLEAGLALAAVGHVQDLRLLAFRTDLFAARSAHDLGDMVFGCAGAAVPISVLESDDHDRDHDQLVIQMLAVDGRGTDVHSGRGRVARFRAGASETFLIRYSDSTSPRLPDGAVDVVRAAAPVRFENAIDCEGDGPDLGVRESVIHLLALPAPAAASLAVID